MKIHKAGYGLLIKLFILLAIVNSLVFASIGNLTVCRIVIGISTVVYLLVVNFFRFPNRQIRVDDDAILCPADGKIVVVEETYEPEYLKRQCIQVSVFMSILNVHINWYAANGIVEYFRYHKGRYMAAYLPKSSTENERTTVAIKPPGVHQIRLAGGLVPAAGHANQCKSRPESDRLANHNRDFRQRRVQMTRSRT